MRTLGPWIPLCSWAYTWAPMDIGEIYKYIHKIESTMSTIKTIFVAVLFVSVPIAGISIWQGDTQDFIQDIFDDEIENEEQSPNSLVDWQVHYAQSSSDLPDCTSATEGRLYFVESDEEFRVCSSSGWQVVDVHGPPGTDGVSVLMRVSTSALCSGGGNQFEIGNDVDQNNVLNDDEVIVSVDICNGQNGMDGVDGINGTNGTNGIDGLNSITNLTNEASGPNCANGGLRLDVGIDLNNNLFLDDAEIEQTQYICNGISTNTTFLGEVTVVPTELGCDAGSSRVINGIDNGDGGGVPANGILEEGEIDTVTTFCKHNVFNLDLYSSGDFFDQSYDENLLVVNELEDSAVLSSTQYLRGLWVTDGTDEGTTQLYSGQLTEDPYCDSPMVEYDGDTYFGFSIYGDGAYLMKTNGTASGTEIVNKNSSGMNDYICPLFDIAGELIWKSFSYEDSRYHYYKLDSMGDNISLFSSAYTDTYLPVLTSTGNKFFFTVRDTPAGGSSQIHGRELWVSDGTISGTTIVKDITPGTNDGVSGRVKLFEDKVLFIGNDESNPSTVDALWISDGTETGTQVLKEMTPPTGVSLSFNSPSYLSSDKSTLYFTVNNATSGYELWKTDGTTSGTMMVKDICAGLCDSYPRYFQSFGNQFIFEAYSQTDGGNNLYISDGTESGTQLITTSLSTSSDSQYMRPYVMGGNIFFSATDGTNGTEYWITDGTEIGTTMLKNIHPSGTSNPLMVTEISGIIYFTAGDGVHGRELWQTDGTSQGTTMVADIYPGPVGSGYATAVSLFGNGIMIVGVTVEDGRELYQTGSPFSVTTEIIFADSID